MKLLCLTLLGGSALGAIFQPPVEIHSVELAEWRADHNGNGHFYEAVESPAGITVEDARGYAKAHGGYLATIASKEENDFVFKLVDDANFWTDSPTGQSWGPWLGGEKVTMSGSDPDQVLHFYSPSLNNRQPTVDYVSGNTLLHGFVVEYDQQPNAPFLGYAAVFAVGLTGILFIGCMFYLLFRKKVPAENPPV